MGIVFFCQSCGARFEVDARMAGKKGRCKACGQMTSIPHAEEIASMVAIPALAGAGVNGGAGKAAPPAVSWLKTAASSVGLAPLTVDRIPIGVRRGSAPSPLDDAEDSKPYALVKPERGESGGRVSAHNNVVGRFWNREVGVVARIFRWLNESAYLLSVPFIMILLFATAIKSRPLALFAATIVVALNVGRFAAGVANLAVVPLRGGFTAQKLKKPFRRVAEPVITVALVFLGFTFIPWLSSGGSRGGGVAERLRSSAVELKGEMKDELEKAKDIDVGKLGAQARERLKELGSPTQGAESSPVDGSQPGAAPPSADAAIGGLIKSVGERARQTIDESQKQP